MITPFIKDFGSSCEEFFIWRRWLRAAVLGANEGLISTSSLVVGVAAAQTARGPVLLMAPDALAAHARDELGLSELSFTCAGPSASPSGVRLRWAWQR